MYAVFILKKTATHQLPKNSAEVQKLGVETLPQKKHLINNVSWPV